MCEAARTLRPALAATLLASLAVTGCESDVPTAAERVAIAALVRPFVVQLAAAYASLDVRGLEGVAAPRLMEQARRDIELLRAGGDRLEPRLADLRITGMKVLRHTTAYVDCTETWDTRRFDAATGQLVGHDPASVLHTHIQLRKVDGRWLVLFREVEETARGPRLTLPTPER